MSPESNLKAWIDQALAQSTRQEIAGSFGRLSDKDKIYVIRVLDYRLKQVQKLMEHTKVVWRAKEEKSAARALSDDPITQLHYQVAQFEDGIYNRPQRAAAARQAQIDKEKDVLLRLTIAREAIVMTKAEEKELYPDLSSLYQKQVKNRKWYQSSAFYITVGCLSTIFSPFVYWLWKRNRSKELIQPNPYTEQDQGIIRASRKNFKKWASNNMVGYEGTFIAPKEAAPTEEKKPAPRYVTRYKKERDCFFRKHPYQMHGLIEIKKRRGIDYEHMTKEQIQMITKSKEEDVETRLTLGIR